MQIKKNGAIFNYHPPVTLPHKESGCMGCIHRDSNECGKVEAVRLNGSVVYRKAIDERCKHGQ